MQLWKDGNLRKVGKAFPPFIGEIRKIRNNVRKFSTIRVLRITTVNPENMDIWMLQLY